jgi:hypothetical protein
MSDTSGSSVLMYYERLIIIAILKELNSEQKIFEGDFTASRVSNQEATHSP